MSRLCVVLIASLTLLFPSVAQMPGMYVYTYSDASVSPDNEVVSMWAVTDGPGVVNGYSHIYTAELEVTDPSGAITTRSYTGNPGQVFYSLEQPMPGAYVAIAMGRARCGLVGQFFAWRNPLPRIVVGEVNTSYQKSTVGIGTYEKFCVGVSNTCGDYAVSAPPLGPNNYPNELWRKFRFIRVGSSYSCFWNGINTVGYVGCQSPLDF